MPLYKGTPAIGPIALDDLTNVSESGVVVNAVLKYNGTQWVPALYDASFVFSLASFAQTGAGSTTQLVSAAGTWITAGGISFTASYNNGPATSAYVSHGGWADLNLAGYTGPTVSASTVAYGTTVGATKVFTLTAYKSPTTVTSSLTFTFLNNRYWGTLTKASGYNNSDVTSLSSEISNSGSKSVNINAASTYYIIFASRTALGTRTFSVGGFTGGFLAPETVSVTNARGFAENYYVYRSTNPSLGSTDLVIT